MSAPGALSPFVLMAGEFGERGRDAPVRTHVDAEFVVSPPQVLHERVTAEITRAVRSRFRPRIGRSRDLSRP